MPTYQIDAPDGNTYRIAGPEGASREEVIQAILAQHPEAGVEKTVGGYAKEALKGFGRGAVNLLEQSAVGAAALLPEAIEKPVVAKTQELAERFTPKAAPGYEEAIPTRLAEGLGSMVTTAFAPGTLARVGMLAAAGAGEARQRAQQEGATPEQISTATAQGILPGLIDVLPVQFLLGKVGKVALDGLISRGVRMAATGGVEGATEAAQNIMQNAIARGYKPEQDLYEGAGEAGAYGAGVGAIAQGLLDLAMPGRARRVTPQQVRAEPPVLETPVPETPVPEAPVPEAPVSEITAPVAPAPVAPAPVAPAPVAPAPVAPAPVAPAPVAPAPVAPAPVAPAPVAPAPVAPASVALATKAPQKQLSWKKFLASNPDETALAARKIENDKRIAEELGKIKPNFYTVNALKEQQKKLDKMLSGAAVQVAPLASLTLKEPKNVNVVPDVGKDAKSDADRKRTEEPVLPPTPDDRTATQPVGGGVDISGKRVGEPVEGAPKQYAPLTVESFVADRIANKLQDSPEEIQFYLNNKDAIEAALKQAQGKAAAKPVAGKINKTKLEKKVQAESDLTPEEQAELQAELDEELGQVTEKPKRRINKAKLEKKVAAPEILSPERQKMADELARVKTAPKAVQKYVAHYKGIDEAIKMLGFETGYKGLVQNERGYLQPSAKEVRVFADWVDSNGTPEQKTALATYQKEAAELKTKAENEQLVKSREQPQKLRRAIRKQMAEEEFEANKPTLTREELAERETEKDRQDLEAITKKDVRRTSKLERMEYQAGEAISDELDADTERYSKAKLAAPTGHTAEGVTKALKKYFKEDSRFDALTTVVQSEKDLPEEIRNSKNYQAGTRGVAYKGKVWLVADNISQGKELGVFLHEAGAHIGFDNVLKASDRKFLADQVRKWAKGNDDLIETKAAKVALEKGGVSDDEIIAYMTEELINRGVSPTNFRPASTWLRRVFDAFKKALAKIGLRKDITPQELVDVAYGAAHIAIKAPGKASVEAPRFSQANPAMDRANPITLDKFSGPSAPKSIVKHAIDSRLGGGGGSVMQKVRQNMASRTTWWEDWFAAIHGNDALDTAGMASANDRLQASTKVRNIQLATLELGGFGKNNKGLWEAQSTDASYKDIIEQVNSMVGKYRATPDFASAEKFFDWAASAKREEGLIAAGKTTDVGGAIKRTLTDTQLKEGLDIYNSTPEIREALRLYEKFNNRNVDTLVTAGVIDAATAQDLKGAAGYVPWFRWTEDKDGNINIARVKSYSKGLINLSEMRDLEGGRIDDIQINSVLDNMARLNNWMVNKSIGNDTAAYMVDYALQYKKARKVGASSAAGLDSRRVVKIMRNGQETFYELEDPMMLAAFKGYETAHGAMTETFAAPARLLRKGITLFPVFSLAQLPQDTIRAFATSGLKNPYALIPRILVNFLKEVFGGSDTSRRLAQFGIVGKGVDIPTDDISKGLRRRFKMGEGQGLHSKAYDMLEKWSNASDAAVRTALYELTMKESQGNEVLALRRAREIINFDIQGSGQYASFLRQTVPFMGVYMNDLNNLYKGLVLGSSRMSEGEKAATRRSIIWNGSQLAALTVIYTLMTMDDDDYKKLDDNTRNRSFIIPGSNLRVPVPSDGVGFIFKVVPEQITRAVFTEGIEGEDIGGRVARALGKGLLDMGSFENYLPGGPLAKVSVETILNRNFYTQNPIVGKSKEHLEPFLQYTEGTSELSKQLAESARKAGIGISPLKVDHLVRGLTGQVGGFVLGMSNALIHAAEGKVTPSIRLEDIAELRAFTYSSRDKAALEDFYELRERVDMVARTYRDFISAGKGKEAIEYLSDPDNQRAYALRNIQVRVEQDLAKFRKMRKLILERTDLTSDDMREELNRLDTRQTQYLESLRLPKLRAFADIFPSLKSNVQKLVQ